MEQRKNIVTLFIKKSIYGFISRVFFKNLSINNEQYSITNPNELKDENIFSTQMIALTFDDGRIQDYTVTSKLLNKRLLKATFYINPVNIGKDGYLTWMQVKELNDYGHDIQCHSYHHVKLTTINEKELRAGFEKVNKSFLDNNLPLPKHHAYPKGHFNKEVMRITADYRLTGRGFGYVKEHYFGEYPSIKDLSSLIICNCGGQYNFDLKNVFRKIEESLDKNQITILSGHGVSNTPGKYDTSIEDFEALLDYFEENNIKVVTMSELYDELLKIYKEKIDLDKFTKG